MLRLTVASWRAGAICGGQRARSWWPSPPLTPSSAAFSASGRRPRTRSPTSLRLPRRSGVPARPCRGRCPGSLRQGQDEPTPGVRVHHAVALGTNEPGGGRRVRTARGRRVCLCRRAGRVGHRVSLVRPRLGAPLLPVAMEKMVGQIRVRRLEPTPPGDRAKPVDVLRSGHLGGHAGAFTPDAPRRRCQGRPPPRPRRHGPAARRARPPPRAATTRPRGRHRHTSAGR